MKKIFNWTVGSFFRTIGRILSYIVIALIAFYFINKHDPLFILKADTSTPLVKFGYKDEFVISNHNKKFFGENGYLEKLKAGIKKANYKYYYDIIFSKDNICVSHSRINNFLSGVNGYKYYPFGLYSYVYSSDTSYTFKFGDAEWVSGKVWSPVSVCLKDYDSFEDMYSDVINDINFDYNNLFSDITFSKSSLIDNDYNLNKTMGNYAILYDYVNNYIDVEDSRFESYNFNGYSSGCTGYYFIDNDSVVKPYNSNLCIHDYSGSVNTNKITYYSLYKYNEPQEDLVANTVVYDNSFIIDVANIDTAFASYSIKYNAVNLPTIKNIEYYGVVKDISQGENKALYHYEKLSDTLITDFNYTFNKSGTNTLNFSFSAGAFTHGDLSSYEKIYVKINYTTPFSWIKDSFKDTSGLADSVIINDLNPETLFLMLSSSGMNSFMFSNSDSSKTTAFYYNNIQSNDILYNQPTFVDITNNKTIETDLHINSYNAYYGTINKLVFEDYTIGGNIALVQNLYANNLNNLYNATGAYQFIFYITPNLYWSNASYTRDVNDNSMDYCVLNDSGNIICNTMYEDFTNAFATYDLSKFNIIKGIMSEDFYGLSGILLTPLNYINELSEKKCKPISLPVPFTDKSITLPCLSNYYKEYAGGFMSLWEIVLYGICVYAIAVNIFKTIKDTLEADKNNVEVIDL